MGLEVDAAGEREAVFAPDRSFGEGGLAVIQLEGPHGFRRVIATDQGPVILGYARFDDLLAASILRLDPSGAPLPGFGDGGLLLPAGSGTEFTDGLPELDGGFTLVGQANHPQNQDFAFFRLRADGRLDEDFGEGGRRLFTELHEAGKEEQAFAIARDRGGRFVGLGKARVPLGEQIGNGFALARVGPDGEVDPHFGEGGGFVYTDPAGVHTEAHDLAIHPDGSLYVLVHCYGPGPGRLCIAHLDATGQLDESFGQRGIVRIPVSEEKVHVSQLTLHGDRLLVAFANQSMVGAARLDLRGGLDESFGGRGVVRHEVPAVWVPGPAYPCGDGVLVAVADRGRARGPGSAGWIHFEGSGAVRAGLRLLPFDLHAADGMLDPEGRLVVAGASIDGAYFAARWQVSCPD